LYFSDLIGVYIYLVYAVSGFLMIIVDWYGTQEYLLGLGVAWTAGFLIFYLFGIINEISDMVYEIPGIVMIIISLYNWGAGTDISRKQKTPIEDMDIEWNYSSG